jgi:hypothetical protein
MAGQTRALPPPCAGNTYASAPISS